VPMTVFCVPIESNGSGPRLETRVVVTLRHKAYIERLKGDLHDAETKGGVSHGIPSLLFSVREKHRGVSADLWGFRDMGHRGGVPKDEETKRHL
jgi:hypothetical protein